MDEERIHAGEATLHQAWSAGEGGRLSHWCQEGRHEMLDPPVRKGQYPRRGRDNGREWRSITFRGWISKYVKNHLSLVLHFQRSDVQTWNLPFLNETHAVGQESSILGINSQLQQINRWTDDGWMGG